MTDQSAYPRDDESENLTDEERNLNALLGPSLDSERSGRPVDRGALLAAHPDLADALNVFFDDYDRLQALAPLLLHETQRFVVLSKRAGGGRTTFGETKRWCL